MSNVECEDKKLSIHLTHKSRIQYAISCGALECVLLLFIIYVAIVHDSYTASLDHCMYRHALHTFCCDRQHKKLFFFIHSCVCIVSYRL